MRPMQKKPTHHRKYPRERPGIARRLNELCDRDAAKALANLIDWLNRFGYLLGLLGLLLKLFL